MSFPASFDEVFRDTGSSTMTGEALRFIAGRRAPAVGVRVVAGHAAQVSLARRVTPAPG